VIKKANDRKPTGDHWEKDYQKKLRLIIADIEAGKIKKLTLTLGRERYQMRDNRIKRAQQELSERGLLVKQGKGYAVAV